MPTNRPGTWPAWHARVDPNTFGPRTPQTVPPANPALIEAPTAGAPAWAGSGGDVARSFSRAGSDRIKMTLDGLPDGEPKTFFALAQKASDVTASLIGTSATTHQLSLRSSAGTGISSGYYDQAAGGWGLDGAVKPAPLRRWALYVASKSAATPGNCIGSIYDFDTGTWSHGSGTVARTTYTATEIMIGNSQDGAGSLLWDGQIAVCGVVPLEISQTTRLLMVDSTSGIVTLDSLAAAGFTAANGAKVFPLDQTSTGTAVTDAVGGSTQTAITGTAVYTDVGNIPFLASVAQNLQITLSATSSSSATVSLHVNATRAATTAQTASVARQANATRTATTTETATVARQTQATRTATTTQTATVARQSRAVRSATTAETATVTLTKVFLRTLSATTAQTATLIRQAQATRSATTAETATVKRDVRSTRSATTTQTGTLVRLASLVRSATTSQTGTLATTKLILRTLAATTAQTASLTRQTQAPKTATTAQTATAQRRTSATRAATTAQTASLSTLKVILRTFTATTAQTAALVKRANSTQAATTTQTVTGALRVNATRSVTSTTTGTVTRQTRATKTATTAQTATVATLKVFLRTFSATTSQVATLVRRTNQTPTVTTTQTATVTRQARLAKAATSTQTATVTPTRLLLRTFTATTAQTGALTRRPQLVKLVAVTETGTLTRTARLTLAVVNAVLPTLAKVLPPRVFAAVTTQIADLTVDFHGAIVPTGRIEGDGVAVTPEALAAVVAAAYATGTVTSVDSSGGAGTTELAGTLTGIIE